VLGCLDLILCKCEATHRLTPQCVNSFFMLPSRLHGVCNENPLAPLIRGLGLKLYRTSGDNSVLYDHDLERSVICQFYFYVLCNSLQTLH
jgi:hypothetical protein